MNIIDKILVGLINKTTPAVLALDDAVCNVRRNVADAIDDFKDGLGVPKYQRVPGVGAGRCEYEIDPETCLECKGDSTCYDFVRGENSCIAHCKQGAISMGEYAEIDPNWCINCGECATFCYHNAVFHNGERVYMTTKRAIRLLLKGATMGVIKS